MIFFVAFLKLVAIVLAYANYVYYAKFQDNALVVGRTNCGKTYFVQKLVVNNFFWKLILAEWIPKVTLSKTREADIQSYFDCVVKFHYRKQIRKCFRTV